MIGACTDVETSFELRSAFDSVNGLRERRGRGELRECRAFGFTKRRNPAAAWAVESETRAAVSNLSEVEAIPRRQRHAMLHFERAESLLGPTRATGEEGVLRRFELRKCSEPAAELFDAGHRAFVESTSGRRPFPRNHSLILQEGWREPYVSDLKIATLKLESEGKGRRSSSWAIRLRPHGSEHAAFPHSLLSNVTRVISKPFGRG